MPNGRYILNDLEFNQEIKQMSDRDLLEFTAKLAYSNAIRITSLESRNNKMIGTVGGIGAVIGAAIASGVDYFLRRGG